MKRAELERLVRQIRYKPGWRFGVDDSGDIVVSARVRDSYSRTRRGVTVYSYTVVQSDMSERDVLQGIIDAVEALEFHETREWFRYRGTRPFNPHK